MESDFTAAQVHLRSARLCLQGSDKVSEEATEALDLLIVAVTTAEIVRDQRNVVWFPDVATRHPQPSRKPLEPKGYRDVCNVPTP